MRRCLSLLAILAAPSLHAELAYTVHVLPDASTLHVTIKIPQAQSGVQLQIPNWAPGSYRLVDNYKGVKNLKAMDDNGKELAIEQKIVKIQKAHGDETPKRVAENDVCTWVIPAAKSVTVEYDMSSNVLDGAMHWSGPSTYIYPVGRTQEKCTLDLRLPDGWKAFTGLNERKQQPGTYDAATYDVLADNPVSAGDLLVDSYVSRGKVHTIVMRGRAKANVDRAYLIKACKFTTDMQAHLFGGAPYDKYIWHFAVNDAPDGAGGLEHLSSTQISLAAGVGPRAVSVISHEFFHLWNVKRIRSKVLGPFDYTKLPDTGALWWLEGVTDYFAHQLLYRYGWWGRDVFHKDIVDNLNQIINNPAYREVSPHEASLRVAEASGGRGNSQGWRISYYPYGWLTGMVLDVELRRLTDGKRTLDDVLLGLWEQNKNDQPGFEEDEIRRLCVKFGGMEMGWFYDKVVMKPGPLPIAETLAKCGLEMKEIDDPYVDVGFSMISDTAGGRVVRPVGPAQGKLNAGDIVLSIDGKPVGTTRREVSGATSAMTAAAKPGIAIKLKVKRGDLTIESEVVPVAATRKANRIVENPNATQAQKALAANWLRQTKF